MDSDSDEETNIEDDKKPIVVPGTSISLVTDEDIIKWREERRKMWLLKISNNKQKHMEEMGLKEEDVKKQKSVLVESRKQNQFIQSIQNQVNRFNPKANLNLKLIQRGMVSDNSKLLDFITNLGDAGLLEYELTQDEKDKLFGGFDNHDNKNRNNRNFNNRSPQSSSSYRGRNPRFGNTNKRPSSVYNNRPKQ